MCISNGLNEIFGTLTNYRQWYFTRYDLQSEIASHVAKHPPVISSTHFEVSDVFDLLTQRGMLSEGTLRSILAIIMRLSNHLIFQKL